MAFYNNSIPRALLDLFPAIGLQKSMFQANGRIETTKQRKSKSKSKQSNNKKTKKKTKKQKKKNKKNKKQNITSNN